MSPGGRRGYVRRMVSPQPRLLGVLALAALAMFGCSSESSEPASQTRSPGATTGAPSTDGGATTSSSAQAVSSSVLSPPLSALEETVIDALAILDIDGRRAELPGPSSASIWAVVDDGSELQVNASSPDAGGDYSVLDARMLDGVTVQRIEYSGSGRTSDRFECSGVAYTADGAVAPDFADFDEFLSAFISALGCGRT